LLVLLVIGASLSSFSVSGHLPASKKTNHSSGEAALPHAHKQATSTATSAQAQDCTVSACEITDTNGLNQSRLKVCLSVRKGKLFVEPGRSSLITSNTFRKASVISEEQTKRLLVDELNRALSRLGYFEIYALPTLPPAPDAAKEPQKPGKDATAEEQQQYEEAQKKFEEADEKYRQRQEAYDNLLMEVNNKTLTKDVRNFSGTWKEYIRNEDDDTKDGVFAKWRRAAQSSESLRKAYEDVGKVFEDFDVDFTVVELGEAILALGPALNSRLAGSPIIYDSEIGDDQPSIDAGPGTICLRVPDPMPRYKADSPGKPPGFPISPKSEIDFTQEALQRTKLAGRPWNQNAINAAIIEFYEDRGYKVNLSTSPGGEANKAVMVRRWQVDRVFLPTMDETQIENILATVLPGKSYKEFIRNQHDGSEKKKYLQPFSKGDEKFERLLIDYQNPAEKDEEGSKFKRLAVDDASLYFNQYRLQRLQTALATIGYTAVANPPRDSVEEEAAYLDLIIVETEDKAKEKEKASEQPADKPASGTAESGAGQPSSETNQPAAEVNPSPTPLPTASPLPSPTPMVTPTATPATTPSSTPSPTPTPSTGSTAATDSPSPQFAPWDFCKGNNFLGGGFEYKPDQGVRYFGVYRCRKLGPGALELQLGGHGGALGGGSYSYTRKRFSLNLNSSSEFEASRLFGGLKTSERRNGGLAHVEWLLSDPKKDDRLRLFAEGRHQTVELLRDDKTISKQNITTLDLGLDFALDRRMAIYPTILKLRPQLRLGLGLAANEPSFTVFTLVGDAHSELTRLLELNLAGRIGLASSRTPIFEQLSFGAAEVVRGFRRDDAIGRKLWSIQPELWLRLRGFSAPSQPPAPGDDAAQEGKLAGLKRMLRESMSLALFYDVGGVYRTIDSQPGLRSGPGLGLRFSYKKAAVFKLDWAYGLGDGVSGNGRGRFYFTIDLIDLQ
jgi:hypothetical protein